MVEEPGVKAPRSTGTGRPWPWAARGRRLRGAVLRLALSRSAAFASGLLLLLPATAVAAADYPWESWLTDGFSLAGLATGVALIVTALGGRRPDWIEPA